MIRGCFLRSSRRHTHVCMAEFSSPRLAPTATQRLSLLQPVPWTVPERLICDQNVLRSILAVKQHSWSQVWSQPLICSREAAAVSHVEWWTAYRWLVALWHKAVTCLPYIWHISRAQQKNPRILTANESKEWRLLQSYPDLYLRIICLVLTIFTYGPFPVQGSGIKLTSTSFF